MDNLQQWSIIDLNDFGMVMSKQAVLLYLEFHRSQFHYHADEQASWAHVLLLMDNYHKWNIIELNVIGMVKSKQTVLFMFPILG